VSDDSRAQPLRRDDLLDDPLRQFQAWFDAAGEAGVPMPEAVALGTAGADGRPAVRFVLLKVADERGFTFYTSYESRKAEELSANPHAALCFYWHELGRQVRVEGSVSPVPADESDAYFTGRPYRSQLSATASRQSDVVSGREELERLTREIEERYAEGSVPRPAAWGGYVVEPVVYEFWQHREDRLHDRFRYRREGDGWKIERLAP